MKKLLGPILYARPDDTDHWSFDIAVLLGDSDGSKKPRVAVDVKAKKGVSVGEPVCIADFTSVGRGAYWSWRIRVQREPTESRIRYTLPTVDPTEYTVIIPKQGQLPRMLFFSCNGFSEAQYMDQVAEPFAVWKHAMTQHAKAVRTPGEDLRGGYHVMIGGGDQVYADSLWYTVKDLEDLRLTPKKNRPKWPIPKGFAHTLLQAYVDLYIERWWRPEMSRAFAQIPGLFTWDDHEIFDGWGSYAAELQGSGAYQAIYRAARSAFEAFQLCGATGPRVGDDSHCLQAMSFPGNGETVDVVLLDLRSERSLEHVMSDQQWKDLNTWLANRTLGRTDRRHLLVVSSIPLVYMRFTAWQEVVGTVADLDDDMRDQWESACHRGERSRLIMTLLAHARLSRSAVTVLSGDVHIASRGRIVSRSSQHMSASGGQLAIEQLTSSGIVHPPPEWWQSLAMRAVAFESDDDIAPDVVAQLLKIGSERYLSRRNYLSLDFDTTTGATTSTRLWAQWWYEPDPRDTGRIARIEPQVVVDAFDP